MNARRPLSTWFITLWPHLEPKRGTAVVTALKWRLELHTGRGDMHRQRLAKRCAPHWWEI